MIPSRHFILRLKGRLGFKKKQAYKYLQKAAENGMYINDTLPRPRFNKYLSQIIKPEYPDRELIVYNRHIIIYSKAKNNKGIGITILDIPHEYYGSLESLKKERCIRNDK